VFQAARSPQSEAIRRATHSPYTHCGMVFIVNGDTRVLEAIEPVCWTPYRDWVARGEEGQAAHRRLREADRVLTPAVTGRMRALGERWLGKQYDYYFEWSDDKLYCSELVYKLYERAAGIKPGAVQKLGDFDLDDFVVRRALRQRYGSAIPIDETVIAPADLFAAEQFITVTE